MRFCPLCDQTVDAALCAECSVPTIDTAVFERIPEDELLGQLFAGVYQVETLLGQGGMGRVYRATQITVGRPVALKTLHLERASERRHVRRFYKEAQAASRLAGAHVVRIYDFGVDESRRVPYIAMEHLRGRTLASEVKGGRPLEPRAAARVASQIAEALVEAGAAGIVHRDLKPANIFLVVTATGEDFVKVMDFGVAKDLREEGQGLTETGAAVGTLRYMAPEQISGHGLDPRADLYALGCVLHEMLSGLAPFRDADQMLLVQRHLSEPPPRLAEGLGVPPLLDEIRRRLLAKQPDRRPQDTRALARVLGALGRGEDAEAATLWQASGAPSSPGVTRSSPRLELSAPTQTDEHLVPAPQAEIATQDDQTLGSDIRLPAAPVRRPRWRPGIALGVASGAAAVALWAALGPLSQTPSGPDPSAISQVAAAPAPLPDLPAPSLAAPDTALGPAVEVPEVAIGGAEDAAPPIPTPATTRRVLIDSEPPARVTDPEGRDLGITPVPVEVAPDAVPRTFAVTARGHAPGRVEVGPASPDRVAVRLTPAAAPTSKPPKAPPGAATPPPTDKVKPEGGAPEPW